MTSPVQSAPVPLNLPPEEALKSSLRFVHDYGDWHDKSLFPDIEPFPEEEFTARNNSQFDVLLVNIVAGPLLLIAERLGRLCRTGGTLALAGFMPQQMQNLKEVYAENGFELERIAQNGSWSMMVGKKVR